MKREIVLVAVSALIAAGTSSSAQDNVATEDISNTRSHIEVEISGETAVIIDGEKYTLPEMIVKAIELNPDIYIARYNAAMSDTGEKQFNTKFSPVLNASGGVSSVTNPEFMYPLYGKKTDSASASISIAKIFSTGTTVAAGAGHTSSNFDTGYGQKYDISSPVVFASIEQELLRNGFGYSDRKQEKILRNVSDMQRDASIYSMSMVALGVIADYWNVVLAQDRLDNAKLMLTETQRVRKIVAEKVNIGLNEKFEINYWNALAASSRAQVSQAEQNYRSCMRKFLRNVNMDRKITMQEKVVLTERIPEINSDEAIKRAFEKRADYLNAVRDLENARLSLSINENSSLPSLKGALSVSSMDYNTVSSGDAYSNMASMKYPSYQAKLSMTYPLDNTGQRADERNAGWIVEQSKQNLEKTKRYVKDDVITKIENISTNYQLYKEAKESSRQAQLYYNSMLSNLRVGRFAASSVRDALSALVSSREMELQLLVAYNASLIEFEVSKNELFDTYGIDIKKYIPVKN